jgi:hypothetical protein
MTYYATASWNYPSGSRVPLGYDVIVYSSTGLPSNPNDYIVPLRQRLNNGGVYSVSTVLQPTVANGTYTDIPLSGGYGANATATVIVANNAITSVTFPNTGDLYRTGDQLTGFINGVQFVLQVEEITMKVVYTTESNTPFKMAVRSVFPDGKSDWVQSGVITPV